MPTALSSLYRNQLEDEVSGLQNSYSMPSKKGGVDIAGNMKNVMSIANTGEGFVQETIKTLNEKDEYEKSRYGEALLRRSPEDLKKIIENEPDENARQVGLLLLDGGVASGVYKGLDSGKMFEWNKGIFKSMEDAKRLSGTGMLRRDIAQMQADAKKEAADRAAAEKAAKETQKKTEKTKRELAFKTEAQNWLKQYQSELLNEPKYEPQPEEAAKLAELEAKKEKLFSEVKGGEKTRANKKKMDEINKIQKQIDEEKGILSSMEKTAKESGTLKEKAKAREKRLNDLENKILGLSKYTNKKYDLGELRSMPGLLDSIGKDVESYQEQDETDTSAAPAQPMKTELTPEQAAAVDSLVAKIKSGSKEKGKNGLTAQEMLTNLMGRELYKQYLTSKYPGLI